MFSTKHLRSDIMGGLTAGVVALPLALGLGVQSGMGAIAGLYGAIFLGFIAAALGGTATQVSGPTGPMTVVSSMVIASFLATFGALETALPYIMATFACAGLFQIVLGFLRVGDLIRFVPYPVISGFMTGIGLIIIILQFFPMLGHTAPKSLIEIFKQSAIPLSDPNFYSLALSLSTLAIIYIVPRFFRAIPSSLIALVVLTIVSTWMHYPVTTIGNIPQGLPSFHWDIWHTISWHTYAMMIIKFALILAALGAIDSLLTSVVADNMTHTRHNSHRELFGQGIGNFIGGMLGGLPGAGATMRTVVNIQNGGKTNVSGITHSLVLLAILLGAGRYASAIPMPVLSGILINVGIGIIDYRGFKQLNRIPRMEAAITLGVVALTVFVDLLTAVGVGVLIAALTFMKSMTNIGEERAYTHRLEEEEGACKLPKKLENKVYVKRLEGPLFFGIATQCKTLLTALPDIDYVIIRMSHVPYMDQSGAYALEDALKHLQTRGITVLLTHLRDQPKTLLTQLGLIPNQVKSEHVFESFQDACQWLKKV